MNWEKLKINDFFLRPVEYIYTSTIFNLPEYDRLYENQNNLLHRQWQEFRLKYKLNFKFHNDLQDIDLKKDIICLWFFKDRSDRTNGKDIKLAGKKIIYSPNTFFITRSKDIKIIEKNSQYVRRPVLQLDMSPQTHNNIMKRFQK